MAYVGPVVRTFVYICSSVLELSVDENKIRSDHTLQLHSYNVIYLLENTHSSDKRRSGVKIGRAHQDVQITSPQRHVSTLMHRYKLTYSTNIHTTSVQRYGLTIVQRYSMVF